jgi:hypothetical protein
MIRSSWECGKGRRRCTVSFRFFFMIKAVAIRDSRCWLLCGCTVRYNNYLMHGYFDTHIKMVISVLKWWSPFWNGDDIWMNPHIEKGIPKLKTKMVIPILKGELHTNESPYWNGDPQIENQNGDPRFEMGIAYKQIPILKWGSPNRKPKSWSPFWNGDDIQMNPHIEMEIPKSKTKMVIPVLKRGLHTNESPYWNGDPQIEMVIYILPFRNWDSSVTNPYWNSRHSNLGFWWMNTQFGTIPNRGPSFKTGIPIWIWVGRLGNLKSGSLRSKTEFVPNWGPTNIPLQRFVLVKQTTILSTVRGGGFNFGGTRLQRNWS